MAFTTMQTIIGLGVIIAGVIGLVFSIRFYLSRYMTRQAEEEAEKSKLKKYQIVNVFDWRNQFMGVGLICSLGLTVLMLGWTEAEIVVDESFLVTEDILEMSEDIVYCPQPPPPPPPPPTIIIVEIPDEEMEEEILFRNISIDKEERMDTIPIDKEIIDELVTVIEIMPVFPGCEDLSTNYERKACTDANLLKFIYQNIKYPSIARENGIEGLVVVQFVVDKEGSIHSPKIMKDIGGGCGAEAIRLVELMGVTLEKLTPGYQRGVPVSIRYNLAVRFRLPQN